MFRVTMGLAAGAFRLAASSASGLLSAAAVGAGGGLAVAGAGAVAGLSEVAARIGEPLATTHSTGARLSRLSTRSVTKVMS